MKLKSTIAMERGDARLWQCSACGAVCYIPNKAKPKGQCPNCAKNDRWSEQFPPVAAFGVKVKEAR